MVAELVAFGVVVGVAAGGGEVVPGGVGGEAFALADAVAEGVEGFGGGDAFEHAFPGADFFFPSHLQSRDEGLLEAVGGVGVVVEEAEDGGPDEGGVTADDVFLEVHGGLSGDAIEGCIRPDVGGARFITGNLRVSLGRALTFNTNARRGRRTTKDLGRGASSTLPDERAGR